MLPASGLFLQCSWCVEGEWEGLASGVREERVLCDNLADANTSGKCVSQAGRKSLMSYRGEGPYIYI